MSSSFVFKLFSEGAKVEIAEHQKKQLQELNDAFTDDTSMYELRIMLIHLPMCLFFSLNYSTSCISFIFKSELMLKRMINCWGKTFSPAPRKLVNQLLKQLLTIMPWGTRKDWIWPSTGNRLQRNLRPGQVPRKVQFNIDVLLFSMLVVYRLLWISIFRYIRLMYLQIRQQTNQNLYHCQIWITAPQTTFIMGVMTLSLWMMRRVVLRNWLRMRALYFRTSWRIQSSEKCTITRFMIKIPFGLHYFCICTSCCTVRSNKYWQRHLCNLIYFSLCFMFIYDIWVNKCRFTVKCTDDIYKM